MTSRMSIRRLSTVVTAAAALAFAALPGLTAAEAAVYSGGGTIAISARLCETIPVNPLDCPNAGGTGALSAVSYAGDVVLETEDALIHGGTLVWGEAGDVPVTGYHISLENMQQWEGYEFVDFVGGPGSDGGSGVHGPYVQLTEQQPAAQLYLVFVVDDGTDDGAPAEIDSDGDGFSDYHELEILTSDPNAWDTDGDGLGDYEEVMTHGTTPVEADADGDGLDDAGEVAANTGSYDPDSDDDGASDGSEVIHAGTDPLDPADFPSVQAGPEPDEIDSDADGASDASEIAFGSDPFDPSDFPAVQAGPEPGETDSDGDGVSDTIEVAYGSDPSDATDYPVPGPGDAGPGSADGDTDDDGISDADEAELGSDSGDAASRPVLSSVGTNGLTAITVLPNTGAGPLGESTHDSRLPGLLLIMAGALAGVIRTATRIRGV